MCSVISGGRLPSAATSTATTNSNKSRNNHLEEMSEGESNPDSPKMSRTEKENFENKNSNLKNDADEELSVGSPGIKNKLC